jgi:hypothetical protein
MTKTYEKMLIGVYFPIGTITEIQIKKALEGLKPDDVIIEDHYTYEEE